MTNTSITDVPGIRVGHWTDRRAMTGCTVVLPDRPATAGVDVRGGAPGTRETDLLRPGNLVESVHAVVLAGGSAYGLEAASGVMRYLKDDGRGFGFGRSIVPIVPAAVIFDLNVGRDRWPGLEEGGRAAAGARPRCEEGNVGAGAGATVGKLLGPLRAMKSGIGTASERASNGLIVGAVVVINAIGNIIDPETGATLAGARDEYDRIVDALDILREGKFWRPETGGQNTVIAVIATNAALTKEQANRLAVNAHDGIARSVVPAHTMGDGDVIFALATGDLPLAEGEFRIAEALAPLVVARAIISGVLAAKGIAGFPAALDLSRRISPQRRR